MSDHATAVVVDVPQAFQHKARWAIDTLLAASSEPAGAVRYPSSALPGSELAWRYFEAGDAGRPSISGDGMLDFGDGIADVVASAFWHLSRWEERPGAARDQHGRFPAAAALADPERPAADALAERFRAAVEAGPRSGGFAVALTHDVDTPLRWHGLRAVRAAAGRTRRAALGRRTGDLRTELRGIADAPLHRLRGSDPNWSFERVREIESRHGGRSTYFVMAGHTHPADGAAPAAYERVRAEVVEQVLAQGDEVALHPSYEASERPQLLREQADLLGRLTGAPVAGVRFHYLRHRTHGTLAELDGMGFTYDSSQGFADRPGFRAGFSHPYHPYDLEADRPLRLVELPLAVMDATLAEPRYLGLTPARGLARAQMILERVVRSGGTAALLWHTDRFDRSYARGWDRVYDELLNWVADRGGRLVTAADAVAGY